MRFCVLGGHIQYTLSPDIHNAFTKCLGSNDEYFVEDIPEDNLEFEVKRLLDEYDGFNVTKPYKEKVARILGYDTPVNTVRKDGKCTSTDGGGFLCGYRYKDGDKTVDRPCGNILILGAGGVVQSLIGEIVKYGATVSVLNRTYQKAKRFEQKGVTAVTSAKGSFDAVINCTSLGLGGEQSAPDSLDFSSIKFAYDLIYSPPVTPFLKKASLHGACINNGIDMLIGQAVLSQEFWRGERFTKDRRNALTAAAKEVLKDYCIK